MNILKTEQIELEIDGKTVLLREHQTPNSGELLFYDEGTKAWRSLYEHENGDELDMFIADIGGLAGLTEGEEFDTEG